MTKVSRADDGTFVVDGVAIVSEDIFASAAFSVRCTHHQEAGSKEGFLYPSARERRPDNRCPFCVRIENSRRPAEVYLAQRILSYRHQHGDPTVAPLIKSTVRWGAACTHKYRDGRLCNAPMKTKIHGELRCARHAGKKIVLR